MDEVDDGMRTAYVHGVELWSPRLPGWAVARAVLRGEQAPGETPVARPSPAVLAPTERRRAPDTVALALTVAAGTCASAGMDPRRLPSVFACTEGDLAISDYMSATLASTPLMISPIRFHNSVHNAAAGYWTIGTGAMQPYTAITAHEYTFGEGLLEALVQAHCAGGPVLCVAYDIEARGPLATMASSRGMLGAGLIVSPTGSANAIARACWRIRAGEQATPPTDRHRPLVEGNAMATCLPLFEAIAMEVAGSVRIALNRATQLEIDLDFAQGPEGRLA